MLSDHIYILDHTGLVRAACGYDPIMRDENLAVSEPVGALGPGRKAVPWAES